jgi:hypothetical protein
MRGRRWSAALPPLLLAGLCAVLGGRVYDEWQALQDPVRIDAPPAAAASAAVPSTAAQPLTPPAPASFAALLERPLFSPTRRPPQAAPAPPPEPAAQAPPEPPQQPIDFSLAGVVISGASRVALVQMLADGHVVQVAEGDEVDGWKAVTIDAQRAVFRRGDSEQELALDYVKPVPPGQVPPPVPQRSPERLPPAPPQQPQPAQPPTAEPTNGDASLDGSGQQ